MFDDPDVKELNNTFEMWVRKMKQKNMKLRVFSWKGRRCWFIPTVWLHFKIEVASGKREIKKKKNFETTKFTTELSKFETRSLSRICCIAREKTSLCLLPFSLPSNGSIPFGKMRGRGREEGIPAQPCSLPFLHCFLPWVNNCINNHVCKGHH